MYDVFAYGTGAIGDAVFSTKLMDYGESTACCLDDQLMIADQCSTRHMYMRVHTCTRAHVPTHMHMHMCR